MKISLVSSLQIFISKCICGPLYLYSDYITVNKHLFNTSFNKTLKYVFELSNLFRLLMFGNKKMIHWFLRFKGIPKIIDMRSPLPVSALRLGQPAVRHNTPVHPIDFNTQAGKVYHGTSKGRSISPRSLAMKSLRQKL